MRLNLVFATFAAVSLALAGCAADGTETDGQLSDSQQEISLKQAAQTPVSDRQLVADVRTGGILGGVDQASTHRESAVEGVKGPRSSITDTIVAIEEENKLKRGSSGNRVAGPVSGASSERKGDD